MADKQQIKNIVFDIGQVLLTFQPDKLLKEKFNLSDAEIKIIADKTFKSETWLEMDRGRLKKEDAADIFVERLSQSSMLFQSSKLPQTKKSAQSSRYFDLTKNIIETILDFDQILNPIDSNVKLLKFYKEHQDYNVYALSNFPPDYFMEAKDKYDFLSIFDNKVISGLVGLIKPEPEIYELLLDRCEIDPAETVFIDDSKVNIEGARNAGINAILYENHRQLLDDLSTLEVELPDNL